MAAGFTMNATERSPKMQCPTCGIDYMRRLQRKSFLERRVYSLFGYFPWECPLCREPHFIKERHQKRQISAAD